MTEKTIQTMTESTLHDEDSPDTSLLDLLQIVVDNLRLLVLGPLAAGLLALGITFTIPPTFTATTKFMPPQQQSSGEAVLLKSLGALGGLAGSAAGIKNPNDQFIGFLKSNSVQDALIVRFQLMGRYEARLKEQARKALESRTKIEAGKDGFITVAVDDGDPVVAAQLANAYVEEMGNLLKRMTITEAQHRRIFFEAQLTQTKEKLTQAEQALKASGINSSVLKSSGAVVSAVAQLQAQITVQETKLVTMRGFLSESAPEYKQGQTELAALRGQLVKLNKSTGAPGPSDADYLGLLRNVKYQEVLFDILARQYESAKVDEARENVVNQIVDYAEPPERKSKPKKALIATLVMVTTSMFLLLFVFARSALHGFVKKPAAVEQIARLRFAFARALGRS
ncbi:GNVR domain-containing protein [Roseateles oligotrophus]|uniref:Lipopolysaccharide biosynthesis protein n=1 Tax=Roseateles oligotrophus TaxID=1769250 RepID=A0ABT2YDY4_9BURK|nr:GNVR domain-containing protein [Roseateles oligotrophus]MCV2368265.1 lipopolysaccharide biosynthesis protein [Roseateles oligotrophus]